MIPFVFQLPQMSGETLVGGVLIPSGLYGFVTILGGSDDIPVFYVFDVRRYELPYRTPTDVADEEPEHEGCWRTQEQDDKERD